MNRGNLIFVSSLVLIAGMSRLLPHPPNFTALGAMALFGGAALSNKFLRILMPLAALFVSDLVLNNTVYGSHEGFQLFYPGAVWTYLAFTLIAIVAPMIIKKINVGSVLKGSLATSLIFFIVSNFGAWSTGVLYPLTAEGLTTAYVAAIPFFGNTLAGDLLFSAVLFGGYYLVEMKFPKLVKA